MKKTVYDFSEVVNELKCNFTPHELADNLRACALRLATPIKEDRVQAILGMQNAVLDACAILDAIVETEVEQ